MAAATRLHQLHQSTTRIVDEECGQSSFFLQWESYQGYIAKITTGILVTG